MKVIFTPEASEALAEVQRYIEVAASKTVAKRYVGEVLKFCESLGEFAPERGNRRDDLRPGLRITNYKGRVVVAFAVELDQVAIIGVFTGGQDYEAILDEQQH
jgi:toxin ParE1/3/4